jgi:hypothetical protein
MPNIDTYLSFVKEQVSVQEKLSKKYDEDAYRRGLHLKTKNNFVELADFLEDIKNRGTRDTSYLHRGNSPQKKIQLTYEEIEGAPEELLRELNLSDADKQEILIEYIIAQEGGITSLDRIMVQLYKRTGEIPKRNTITTRLYRMANRGMIYNVPGKKGVYSTYELSEDDAKKMFGAADVEADPSDSGQASPTTPPSSTPGKRRLFVSTTLSRAPDYPETKDVKASGVQSFSFK